MAIARHQAVSVGTSATALPGTEYPNWLLQNLGVGDVFIGGSGVTTATGLKVADGATFSPSEKAHEGLTGKVGDRMFGVCAATTRDVRIILQGKDPNV